MSTLLFQQAAMALWNDTISTLGVPKRVTADSSRTVTAKCTYISISAMSGRLVCLLPKSTGNDCRDMDWCMLLRRTRANVQYERLDSSPQHWELGKSACWLLSSCALQAARAQLSHGSIRQAYACAADADAINCELQRLRNGHLTMMNVGLVRIIHETRLELLLLVLLLRAP